ncbi:MAG: EF-hand domain-containing protein [archaeon]|nr:EF-hand domain-containing protein [archaeon]
MKDSNNNQMNFDFNANLQNYMQQQRNNQMNNNPMNKSMPVNNQMNRTMNMNNMMSNQKNTQMNMQMNNSNNMMNNQMNRTIQMNNPQMNNSNNMMNNPQMNRTIQMNQMNRTMQMNNPMMNNPNNMMSMRGNNINMNPSSQMQSMGNDNNQRLYLKRTKEETGFYSNLFQLADKMNKGVLTGKEAADFLKKSGLSKEILKQIWLIAAKNKTQSMDKDEFYIALRLIALAQNGYPVSKECIINNSPIPPLPKFDLTQLNPTSSDMETMFAIVSAEFDKYKKYFDTSKEQPNKISLSKVNLMWRSMNNSDDVIKKVFELLQPIQENGFLNEKEFQVGLHLVSKSRSIELPQKLPNCLSEYLFGKKIQGNQNPNEPPKDSLSSLMTDLGFGRKQDIPQNQSNNLGNQNIQQNPNMMNNTQNMINNTQNNTQANLDNIIKDKKREEDKLMFTMQMEEMEKILKTYSEINNKNYELSLQIHETVDKIKQGKSRLVKLAMQIDSENQEFLKLTEELSKIKNNYDNVIKDKDKLQSEYNKEKEKMLISREERMKKEMKQKEEMERMREQNDKINSNLQQMENKINPSENNPKETKPMDNPQNIPQNNSDFGINKDEFNFNKNLENNLDFENKFEENNFNNNNPPMNQPNQPMNMNANGPGDDLFDDDGFFIGDSNENNLNTQSNINQPNNPPESNENKEPEVNENKNSKGYEESPKKEKENNLNTQNNQTQNKPSEDNMDFPDSPDKAPNIQQNNNPSGNNQFTYGFGGTGAYPGLDDFGEFKDNYQPNNNPNNTQTQQNNTQPQNNPPMNPNNQPSNGFTFDNNQNFNNSDNFNFDNMNGNQSNNPQQDNMNNNFNFGGFNPGNNNQPQSNQGYNFNNFDFGGFDNNTNNFGDFNGKTDINPQQGDPNNKPTDDWDF